MNSSNWLSCSNRMEQTVFTTQLRRLTSRRIWHVAQSEFNGSVFSLQAGAKIAIRYSERALSSRFAASLPKYEGEYRVFVQGEWVLSLDDSPLCTSSDSPVVGGPIDKGLARLVNKRIQSATLFARSLDLHLLVDGGLRLEISSFESLVEECYDVFMRDYEFSVSRGGHLAVVQKLSAHDTGT